MNEYKDGTKPILKLGDITKNFGDTLALKGVSLNAYKGKCMAVLGENGAGKSTLMNIISGVFPKTSGNMYLREKEYKPSGVKDAEHKGIVIIHQELNTISEMSILNNVFMGNEIKTKLGTIDYRKEIKILSNVLNELEIFVDVQKPIKELSVAQQQMIEIAKGIIRNAEVLIMDEPTSSLSNKETEKLFEVIYKMKEQGKAIIYISHRLQEIPIICENITIIRDGYFIGEWKVGELTEDQMIAHMVGRDVKEKFPPKFKMTTQKIAEVKILSNSFLKNINFEIKKNEILGFAGLVGAKRTELFKTLIGLYPSDIKEFVFENKRINFKSPAEAIKKGFYYVTEDRKVEGLFLQESIKLNMSMSSLTSFKNKIFKNISSSKVEKAVNEIFIKTAIKAANNLKKVGDLSGGNQQKVLLGKALCAKPKIIIFDEPTRGVDVGARREIYDLIADFKKNGNAAIIVISNDLPEIIGISDRILVMKNGMITKEIFEGEMSQEKILKYAI